MEVKYEREFVNGKLSALLPLNENGDYEGVAKWFREDGSLRAKAVCRGGKITIKNEYSKNGNLFTSKRFYENEVHTLSIFENGECVEKNSFSSFKNESGVLKRFKNGFLYSKTLIRNGCLLRSHFYKNGILDKTTKYVSNIPLRTACFDNRGRVWSETLYYPNGKPQCFRMFWENGNIKREENYGKKGGLKMSGIKNFDKEGRLLKKGESVA